MVVVVLKPVLGQFDLSPSLVAMSGCWGGYSNPVLSSVEAGSGTNPTFDLSCCYMWLLGRVL